MKKQLTVALGLAVLATPVFASKARLQALGEDNYGSAYINDNRNIWLNAAQINNHKDMVTYELGDTQNADNASTPRGEGGITKAHGNMVYGLHFGGASSTSNGLRQASTGSTTAQEQNNVDVFVGGDAGMKWGANLGYAKTAAEGSPLTSESMRTRLGVIMGDTQGYANVNLINNAKATNGAKFEGKMGYQVGVIHAWEGNTLFADYRQFDGEATAVAKNDIGYKQLMLGIGRVERLNDKANLFAKVSVVNGTAMNDGSSTTTGCSYDTALGCKDYKTTRVPVVVGLETDATSWLTLRGSIGQVVWGTEESKNDERTIQNSTIVNAGATLKFGELSVDGVVGNDTTGAAPQASGTTGASLRTDQIMSRVSMTYRF